MVINKPAISFTISLLAILFFPLLLPKLHLFYFAPFIILSFYQLSRIALLWRALLCGVIVDLLSSGSLFGMSSLNYCIVSSLLYGQKRNFFEDKLSTLPLMTFLFSLFSSLVELVSGFFSNHHYPLSPSWMMTDLLGMAGADALYALLFFSIPNSLISSIFRFYFLKTKRRLKKMKI